MEIPLAHRRLLRRFRRQPLESHQTHFAEPPEAAQNEPVPVRRNAVKKLADNERPFRGEPREHRLDLRRRAPGWHSPRKPRTDPRARDWPARPPAGAPLPNLSGAVPKARSRVPDK